MKVYTELAIAKEVAASLPRNPQDVQECIARAEVELNVIAGQRNRVISERPHLVQISDIPNVPDQISLRFEAETRSL